CQPDPLHAFQRPAPPRHARPHVHEAERRPDGPRHGSRDRQRRRYGDAADRIDHQLDGGRIPLDAHARQPRRRCSPQQHDPDTDPAAMSAATVAADGITVTITWSENLDQTQAVPGSSFSIAPNGGAGIVGTAAAVSYPAADQTRFALSSDVDHLDALALTYTK